jgi:serum/glucocorticoid-regulated kinase 2
MDGDGNLRLTDFGLSKEGVTSAGAGEGGTKTFCGTPEYLAPEILENHGHGKAVDWWSLGTLLFEMLHGLPPFYDQNMKKMYERILHAPLVVPDYFSAEAKSLVSQLLTRKVEDRLGSGPLGAAEIKAHPFFSTLNGEPFDFEKCLRKEYDCEFKPPKRSHSLDVRNFDGEFTKELARVSDAAVMTGTQVEKSNFVGFTFTGEKSAIAGGKGGSGSQDSIAEEDERD